MKVYNPEDLSKMLSNAQDIMKKRNDPTAMYEFMYILQKFMCELDEFNVKYGESEPFRFKIEPLHFGDKNNGKR